MSVTAVTSTIPPTVPSATANIQQSGTGFWALFSNTQTPEAAPDTAPATTSAAPVGFWTLFGDPQQPNPAAPVSGPNGFEALFGNDLPIAANTQVSDILTEKSETSNDASTV